MARRLEVCHLNKSEVKALEEHGKQPNCEHHRHVTIDRAHQMVGKTQGWGLARWVGETYHYITDILQTSPRTVGQTKYKPNQTECPNFMQPGFPGTQWV